MIHFVSKRYSKNHKEKIIMKKVLATLLAVVVLFTFCACGSSNQEQTGLDGADQTQDADTQQDTTSGSDLKTDPDAPRYTSDGELIVEEDLPASDSDLSE